MTMESNVVQFPYSASRRAHSRKPRKSKNGTPEERAARAAAATAPSATVTEIRERNVEKRREAGVTLVEFMQGLRAYFVQEFARGRDLDQIFDGLEESYRHLGKAP